MMHDQEPNEPSRLRPRFGLRSMLIVMLVFAVMAASAGYFVRSFSNQTSQAKGTSLQLVFFLFTLAAPLLLMVVLSVVRQFIAWLGRPRRS